MSIGCQEFQRKIRERDAPINIEVSKRFDMKKLVIFSGANVNVKRSIDVVRPQNWKDILEEINAIYPIEEIIVSGFIVDPFKEDHLETIKWFFDNCNIKVTFSSIRIQKGYIDFNVLIEENGRFDSMEKLEEYKNSPKCPKI